MKASSILYRKIEVGPSALTIHVKDAKLETDLSQLTLYNGQGTGKVNVDGAAATPAIAMNFSLSGVKVEPLFEAALGMDRLTGTGKLNFDVTSTGKSQRALVSALNGKGAFDIVDGEIKGVNLAALAANAAKSLAGGTGGDNVTDFAALTGTFTITNGILKNSDLQLKSGVVPMTGAGTVDLPHRTVDYRVSPSLAGVLNVPIIVSGPWDNLSYRPDLAGARGHGQGAHQHAGRDPQQRAGRQPGSGRQPASRRQQQQQQRQRLQSAEGAVRQMSRSGRPLLRLGVADLVAELHVGRKADRDAEKSFRGGHYQRHNARRLEHLASLRLDLAGKRVLEVGAGIGDHTTFFLDRDCTVVATEPRPENCRVFAANLESSRRIGYAKVPNVTLLALGVEDIAQRVSERFD